MSNLMETSFGSLKSALFINSSTIGEMSKKQKNQNTDVKWSTGDFFFSVTQSELFFLIFNICGEFLAKILRFYHWFEWGIVLSR